MTSLKSLSFEISRDLLLINLLSVLLVTVIALFPDSPARTILGLSFILFFPGYVLICALFPRKNDLDAVDRLALSMGLSIAVTSLIGLGLNYTAFGIRLYSVTFSLFLFILLVSIVAVYRRRNISPKDVYAPFASIGMYGWRELGRPKNKFVKSSNGDIIIKIIAIICFVLLSIASLIAWNSPAAGYESSIYTATPLIVWIFLITSWVCGITIVVHQLYANKHEKDNLWIVGLLLILLCYTLILSLWIIRGYTLWCPGDPLYHIGTIRGVISNGHIASTNFYPIMHIYLSEIALICNIIPEVLSKYIPLIFGLFYVVFMYILAKSVLPEKGHVILATVASTALLHGWYINLTPNHLANLIFPLVFFLLVKSFTSGAIQWKVFFIIAVILFPPLHPVPSIALLVILLTMWLPDKMWSLSTTSNKNLLRTERVFKFITPVSLVLIVWVISWISSFGIWDCTIRNVNTIITEGGPTHLGGLIEDINYAGGYGYSLPEEIFKNYGGTVIYIILAVVAFPILWKRASERNLRKIFSLYGPLIVITLLILVFFMGNVMFSPFRLLVYVVMICTIFAGFTLYEILKKAHHRHSNTKVSKMVALLVIIILMGTSINGVLKLYPSPYTMSTNFQITQTELDGADWFFHNKDVTIFISTWYYAHEVFADFLLSKEEKENRRDLTIYTRLVFPFHFGYENNSMQGQSYTRDVYLVITERLRRIYIDVYPRMAEIRLLPGDFEKLVNDPSVDKLYSNGGFDVWYVHAVI